MCNNMTSERLFISNSEAIKREHERASRALSKKMFEFRGTTLKLTYAVMLKTWSEEYDQ